MGKWIAFAVVALVLLATHAAARGVPKETTLDTQPKDGGDKVAVGEKDGKNFIAFGGVGGAAGVGGVVGVLPIGDLGGGCGGLPGGMGGLPGLGGDPGGGKCGGSGLGGSGSLVPIP